MDSVITSSSGNDTEERFHWDTVGRAVNSMSPGAEADSLYDTGGLQRRPGCMEDG